MTAAELRERAGQCRERIALQLSFAAKKCLERAADSYEEAASSLVPRMRGVLTRQAEGFERLADEAAALVARHGKRGP